MSELVSISELACSISEAVQSQQEADQEPTKVFISRDLMSRLYARSVPDERILKGLREGEIDTIYGLKVCQMPDLVVAGDEIDV